MCQDIHKASGSSKTNRRRLVRLTFFALLLATVFSSFGPTEDPVASGQIDKKVVTTISGILQCLDSLDLLLDKGAGKAACRKQYELARGLYKEIEFYTEYHFSFHSKQFINAPLVNKAEFEYNYKTFVPHGFQVIEAFLYAPEPDTSFNSHYELALLKQTFKYVGDKSRDKQFKNSTVVDMLRFELLRIMSLYLNGYDCTVNKQNLAEIKHILKSIEQTLELLPATANEKTEAGKLIANATLYLSEHTDYDAFNRLHFIITYLKPLYESCYHFYDEEAKKENTNYAVNIRREKFYDQGWFNKNYFSVVLKDSTLVDKQAELGRLLFFDPVLSGNNQRACASCHDPKHAFGGNVNFNKAFGADKYLRRNTPPLVNAFFQKTFFTDGKSMQLEDQASDVLSSHQEMFSAPKDIVYKLQQSPGYRTLFHKAFVNTEDTAITYYALLKAISEYERKLLALNSRFDKYIRGDKKQLSADEIKGYTIFAGKALCGSCHFFPLFNGLTPPFYGDNEFEVIGVPKNKLNKELDPDSGRYHVSKNAIHLASFKTPGIRNIEFTAPYMHNGIYNTLEEVIDFYKKGGGAGLGIAVHNQTLPFDSLRLSSTEVMQLKKFMLSLTDKSFKQSIPVTLPEINLKGLKNRKVGGSY
jgi:cytochrome c peroxidase